MIGTVFLVLLILITIGGILGLFVAKPATKMIFLGAAVFGGILTVVAVVITCVDQVPTRDVGIVTQFGRPISEHGNGIVWHPPWQEVSTMDGAIQLQSFQGNSYDDSGTAIKVRLGNNSTAFVESNLNWRIRPGAAMQMFQDYRTFDNIRLNLVDKQLQVMLSHRFAPFNPQQQTQGADLPGIANLVKGDLQGAVGQDIEILDVRIPGIFYDKGTQDRIDQFNQKAQETKNAEQDVKTAEQQRLAAEQRANQPPPDLRIAIFNCLNDMVKAGRDPAGCWGQVGTAANPIVTIPAPGR